jgi:hypothetical protein
MIIVTAKKKKIDLEEEFLTLQKIKEELQKHPIAREICKEYNVECDIIQGIPICFEDDLEASAKTVEGSIYLNSNLLDEDFETIMRYAIHELVHALQHMRSGEPGQINFDKTERQKDYLDQDAEIEAFQKQVEYQEDTKGPKDVVKYIDGLLKYHKIPKDKRIQYAKKLLEEVEDPETLQLILKSLKKKTKGTSK